MVNPQLARERAARFVTQPNEFEFAIGADADFEPLIKFDPNQPRDPAGTDTGGQWTDTAFTASSVTRTVPQDVKFKRLVDNAPELADAEEDALSEFLVGSEAGQGITAAFLRSGGVAAPHDVEALEEALSTIDEAIAKSSFDKDVTVYRGVNLQDFGDFSSESSGPSRFLSKAQFKEMIGETGDVYRDRMYKHTSMSRGWARLFGETILEIKIPKGKSALPIPLRLYPPDTIPEREIILPRNTGLRLLSSKRGHYKFEVI